MKKCLLALLLFSCTETAPVEPIDQDKDKAGIQNVLDTQVEAWNNADVDSFMEGYWNSPDLMFIGGSGITTGWQETLDNYKVRYPTPEHMGTLNFVILRMDFIAKDNYLVVGEYHLKRTIGDADGIFSLIFKRIDGEWVIVADHTSAS